MSPSQSERDIQASILAAFAGDTRLRLWRSNSGTARSPAGDRFVRFGVPGQGDLSGILQGGRRLEIEVKSASGRQSQQQLNFMEMIRRYGGLYVLARSVDEAVRGVAEALAAEGARARAAEGTTNDGRRAGPTVR